MSLAIQHQIKLIEIFNKNKLNNVLVLKPSKILSSSKYDRLQTELGLGTEE